MEKQTDQSPSKYITPSFQIVLDKEDSATSQIPLAFVEKYGKYVLREKAKLKVTIEKCWEVDVEKDGENMYFHNGWEAFVRSNHLELGAFIMFKYVGNSTFKVEMYNKTRCEKELCGPITSDDKNSEPMVVGIDEKKEVKQKLDYLEDDQILKMGKSSMFVAYPTQSESKKGTTVDENGSDTHDAGSKGTDGDGSERTKVINIDEEIGSGKSLKSCIADVPRMRKHRVGTSSSEALQEAKTLRFRVILEHDLVQQGVQVLKMPSDLFTRLGRELKKVVLMDLVSDKLWEVDVKKDGENIYFHKGWKEFVDCTLQRYKKYLLVFKYVEDSMFEVKKSGKVSCEKKANSIANHHKQESNFVCRPTKCEDTKSKTVVGNGASEAKRTQPNEDEGEKRSMSESFTRRKDDQQVQVKSKTESELKRKRIDVDDHEIYRMQKRSEPVSNSTEYEGLKGIPVCGKESDQADGNGANQADIESREVVYVRDDTSSEDEIKL